MRKIFISATAPLMMLLGSVAEAAPYQALASWYGPGFYGNLTANGEIYTGQELTVAHKTLPFGTRLRVCYDSCVTVRVNDRGPYIGAREFDLSQKAAETIGLLHNGVDFVSVEPI